MRKAAGRGDIMGEGVKPPMSPDTTRACRYCDSPMPERARYCLHCEKFQKPSDQFLSAVSLSALVSLISVASLAYGFVAQQIKKSSPQVVLTPVVCSIQDARVALSNLGERPALFLGGTISAPAMAGRPAISRLLVGEAVPSLIAPQSSKIETLQVAALSPPHFPLPFPDSVTQAGACQFDLKLSWTDGANRKHMQTESCTCGGG